MGVNVISGLAGKLLLARSHNYVRGERESLQERGLSPADIEKSMFWDKLALDVMAKWRKIHIPIHEIQGGQNRDQRTHDD